MAAACNEVDAERGEGDADSPRAVGSPLLPFEEVMMRGRPADGDGDEGGRELRSGAMLRGGGRTFHVLCRYVRMKFEYVSRKLPHVKE